MNSPTSKGSHPSQNLPSEQEFHLQGAIVSEGIAIGEPFFLDAHEEEVPEFPIELGEVETEIARYRRALFSSREDLKQLHNRLEKEGENEAMTIIAAHIQMLDDPLITTEMEAKIRHMHRNTESVFHSVIEGYKERFSAVRNTFFQQRLIDVVDLSQRILGHLRPQQRVDFEKLPKNAVVFAEEITPSESAAAHASRIAAFVTKRGGGHSHAALIARAKGIPFVANIDLQMLHSSQGRSVIVDGLTGNVIVNPRPETLIKYQELQAILDEHYKLLEKDVLLPAETTDGKKIQLLANVGSLDDLVSAMHYGAEGVGLFRSEYLLTQDPSLLTSEEKQYDLYVEAIEKSQGCPLTMRLFDLGGDKYPELYFGRGQGAALGSRGIQFLLRHQEILRIQLRALLRAACHGNIRLLIPFVSEISELDAVKGSIAKVRVELAAKGKKAPEAIPLGCMIELPAAVFLCSSLCCASDFLSIGTNDLIQYTLGIDRNSPEVDTIHLGAHPSIVQMVHAVVREGQKQAKAVTVCGEMATSPLFVPLLIGLGVEEFSCAPRFFPIIRGIIRKTSWAEAQRLAKRILKMSEAKEIAATLRAPAKSEF